MVNKKTKIIRQDEQPTELELKRLVNVLKLILKRHTSSTVKSQ